MFTTNSYTTKVQRTAEKQNKQRPLDKTRTKKAKRTSRQRKGN